MTDRLKSIIHHPYLSVTAVCILAFFFGFCEKDQLMPWSYLYACCVGLLFDAYFCFVLKPFRKSSGNLFLYTILSLYLLFSIVIIRLLRDSILLMFWLFALQLVAMAVLLKLTDQLTEKHLLILLIAAGIMLRFVYVLYTNSNERQHDVGHWGGPDGHASYIEYWFQNGLRLPQFDVRSIWQFYHAPLHHWIMAGLLKLLTTAGMPYAAACQALQILPLYYSSIILVVCYRLFRLLGLDGVPLLSSMTILCFHPTFVILGGSYNNDVLSILFMMLSMLLTLKWLNHPDLEHILPLAFTVGLGMMTKLSAWMVAPAIALMFLCKGIQVRKRWRSFLLQFTLFGLISIPLGLWWEIRNTIAYHVPITYIPMLSKTNPQYCGDMSVWKRLFDFSLGTPPYVYTAFTLHGGPYNEFNPTLTLIKTALFDECKNGITVIHFPSIAWTGPILFLFGSYLGIFCAGFFFVNIFRKNTILCKTQRAFLFLFAITLLASYYLFCFQYPFSCTMNIRYCTPLIPLFSLGLGLHLKQSSGTKLHELLPKKLAIILVIGFAIFSCIVYTQVG